MQHTQRERSAVYYTECWILMEIRKDMQIGIVNADK